MENQLSNQYNIVDNVERIYVDWPEIDHDEFRFISSRIEDVRNDTPSFFQPDIPINQIKKSEINQFRFKEKSLNSNDKTNSRYEDLTRKRSIKKLKNSSVPPLDLISQNSSVELPGTKGVIDIDLRSSSESFSDTSQDSVEPKNENIERDSLENEKLNQLYNKEQNQSTPYGPLLKTKLPEVRHSDLVINPGEYDSSRINEPSSMRKFSDISVPSQYRVDNTSEMHHQRVETEKAIFESVKQKYKQPIRNNNHNIHESQKYDPLVGSQQSKPGKSKPTLSVAPQMKNPLHSADNPDKSPNFVELNKNIAASQKQSSQMSYAAKFMDKYKKEPPPQLLKKSESCKDSLQYERQHTDKGYFNRNPEFSSAENLNQLGKFVEKTTSANPKVNTHDVPYRVNNFPINYGHPLESQSYKSVESTTLLYALNQYGEPVLINPNSVIIANSHPNVVTQHHIPSPHASHPEPYIPPNLSKNHSAASNSSTINSKSLTNKQDLHKSTESDIFFKDASFKRQPTLYDEKLLIKKLKDIKVEVSGSRFPPIPNTSDSSNSYSYVANQRRKEPNYDQYTLRDFKNIKQIDSRGGLGPNVGTDIHKQQKEKFLRQKNYAKAVNKKNLQEFIKQSAKTPASGVAPLEHTFATSEDESGIDKSNTDIDPRGTNQNGTNPDEQRVDVDGEVSKSHRNVKTVQPTDRDPVKKRDAMLNYAKAIQEKQNRKRETNVSKTQTPKSQSANSNKDVNKMAILELIDNSDLDRLVQRHENDKKMADQIRRNLGKIS